MNWLTESIVVLWFLPVVLFIVLPLALLAFNLGLTALKGVFGRKGSECVQIVKQVGAGV